MRKLAIGALIALVTCGAALATPSSITPPPTYGGSQHKGATTNKYTANYFNAIGGTWSLTGVRVVNKNYVKDSFTGTISDLTSFPAGEYTFPGNAFFYWLSDLDGRLAVTFDFTVTDNGDGTGTITGWATY